MNKFAGAALVIAGLFIIADSFIMASLRMKHDNLLQECVTRGHVKIVEDVNGRSIYLWHSEKTEGEDAAPNPS